LVVIRLQEVRKEAHDYPKHADNVLQILASFTLLIDNDFYIAPTIGSGSAKLQSTINGREVEQASEKTEAMESRLVVGASRRRRNLLLLAFRATRLIVIIAGCIMR
jgi:hypothetical protein